MDQGASVVEVRREARTRPPKLQEAFDHFVALAESADVGDVEDPERLDLLVARHCMTRYGDLGPSPDLDGVRFEPVSASGVPAQWVTTKYSDPSRRVVYLHGGGWRSGTPGDYRFLTAVLAQLTKASVLLVDYRLAPEHRFPAGLDDCVTAFEWAVDHGPSTAAADQPAQAVLLVGDSAGGNLSAATCLRLVAQGRRVPDRLAIIAGTLDNVEVERRTGIDDILCTPEAFAACTHGYLPPGHQADDPFVSPVLAPAELLTQFPPTLLQASTIESLLWDSRRFADRLADAGVRVNLSLWPEMPHVWHMLLGHYPEAREALAEIAEFVS
jgi:acetyl esterase/lipase